jgi:hypothetical protein
VRLREAGLLPGGTTWALALLPAYLEQGAVRLGLDPALRITATAGLAAGLGGAGGARGGADMSSGGTLPGRVPPPRVGEGGAGNSRTGSAETGNSEAGSTETGSTETGNSETGSAETGSSRTGKGQTGNGETRRGRSAAGGDAGGGLVLAAGGTRHAACGWAPADPRHPVWPAAGLAGTFSRLCSHLSEPPVASAARLAAAAACLGAAGAGVPLAFGTAGEDRWAVLEAGGAQVATTVVRVAGLPWPVAIALTTGALTTGAITTGAITTSRPGRGSRGSHRAAGPPVTAG